MTSEKEALKFVDEQTNKIKGMYKTSQYAYFEAITSGKPEAYKKSEVARLNFERFFNDKPNFELARKYYQSGFKDELLNRQLTILHNSYLGSQGDMGLIGDIVGKSTEVERLFNTFRSKLGNKLVTSNEIRDILKTEKDSEKLRDAWIASKQSGKLVEKNVLKLVRLRNKLAQNLGFDNYYDFSLTVNEQKEEDLVIIFSELAEKTEIPFRNAKRGLDEILSKRYKISADKLKPWHYQEPFFGEAPSVLNINLDEHYNGDVIKIATDFYSSIGLNVKDILVKSDLYERAKKYPHACCMDMDREGDTRIIESVKNNDKWMETTLHELGHALYNKGYSANKKLPYILKDAAHIFTTEAIAQLFGRNSRNINFLKRYSSKKIDSSELENIAFETSNMLKLKQLIFFRWSQVMFNFERQLYKNPEQDLNKLWYNLVKKYQFLDFSRDEPDWASKIHFVTSPIYYHNYALGELLGSQINNYIGKNILKQKNMNNLDYYGHKEIGKYLNENVFSHGMRYKWDKFVEVATGEKLNPKYWLGQFAN